MVVTTLFLLLMLVLIVVVAFWVISQMTLPAPANLVARVIVGVIALLALVGMLLQFFPGVVLP